jgi:dTDP-4-dehydrorhamnose reductase
VRDRTAIEAGTDLRREASGPPPLDLNENSVRDMSATGAVALEPPAQALTAVEHAPHLARRLRVLVTGAGGMLASDVIPTLAAHGHDVVGRSRAELDITNRAAIAEEFEGRRPEVVVNCAAFTRVDACETDSRAAQVNDAAVGHLAAACAAADARLVHLSTDFVFDGSSARPYGESDLTAPLSAYGRAKRSGELRALELPDALVVRTSWLFGNGGWNFVEAILKQVEEGRSELRVVDDQLGRPTATTDLAEAIVMLLSVSAAGIVHFANRGEVTWYGFAREILRVAGHAEVRLKRISSAELARPARRPAFSVLDTTRYAELTRQPIRDFRQPLAEYLARRARPEA